MKRIFSFCLAILCAFAISVPSHAYDVQRAPENTSVEATPIATFTRSEYDIYQELQATPVAELLEAGYSEEDIEAIKNTSAEELIFERAQLPEDELLGLGYTEESIKILKEYDGSPLSQNPQLRSVLSTMSGSLSVIKYSTNEMAAQFFWTWSSAPFFSGLSTIDVVACAFLGLNTSNLQCGVAFDSKKSVCEVNYYYEKYYGFVSQEITIENKHQFVKAKFPMSKEYDNGLILAWARQGYFTVYVKEPVTVNDLAYTDFTFGYAHAKLGVTPNINVSIGSGGPTGGIGLSFGSTAEQMFYRSISIKSNGQYELS